MARVARRFRFSALAFALFAMAAVAYAVTAYAGYRGVREMAALDSARQKESTTLLLLERTMGTLVDLETGQRGYILSGRDEFLQPFVTARTTLQRLRPELGAYIDESGSAPVRAMRSNIDRLIEQRVAAAEDTIERRRMNAYEPQRDLVEHVKAKQLMDELRDEFATLEAYQSAILDRRRRDSEDVAAATSSLVGGLTAGGSLLMAGALWLLWRERRLRDAADAAVRFANERLEHQVSERTEALSEAMVRIQSFAGQLDQRIEEERRRLSREVHDQLGQVATVAKLVVGDLARAHPELP
ncbi:MAG: CHASE3 domain-containing protein, partial [Rhizobacter sp.]